MSQTVAAKGSILRSSRNESPVQESMWRGSVWIRVGWVVRDDYLLSSSVRCCVLVA